MQQFYQVIYEPHHKKVRIKATRPLTLQDAIDTARKLTEDNPTDSECYSLELCFHELDRTDRNG